MESNRLNYNYTNGVNNRYDTKTSLNNLIFSKQFTEETEDKYNDILENNRIINTLRSNQSLNNEDIKYLPEMLLEMQEALKKSNTNVLELKETISDLLKREKKYKNKISQLELEHESVVIKKSE